MIQPGKLCVPVLAAAVLLTACGGASESTVEQTEEIATTASDTATELATDADANAIWCLVIQFLIW